MAIFDIVFEGGGAKGTGFVGALDALFAAGHRHRRLIGTSAGAITATLLGAGYSPAELLDAVNQKVPETGEPIFTSFLDAPQRTAFSQGTIDGSVTVDLLRRGHVPGMFEHTLVNGLLEIDLYRELFSFVECGGFYSGDAFLNWLRTRLQAKGINPDITWKDFARQTQADVSVVTSDVDDKEMVVLNHRTAPGARVAMSVRMSMSIPFVWREVIWDAAWGSYRGRGKTGHRFVDGGVLSNFPIHLIADADAEVVAIMGTTDPNGAGNLGLLLDEDSPVPGEAISDTRRPRLRTADRVSSLVDLMTGSSDAGAIRNHPDAVCRIPVGGYGTTEFRMSKARMDALIDSGRNAMRVYLGRPAPRVSAASGS